MLHHCKTPAILPWSATVTAALVRLVPPPPIKCSNVMVLSGSHRNNRLCVTEGRNDFTHDFTGQVTCVSTSFRSEEGNVSSCTVGKHRCTAPVGAALPPHPWREQVYTRTSHTHLREWITAGRAGEGEGGGGLYQCHFDSSESQPRSQVTSFRPWKLSNFTPAQQTSPPSITVQSQAGNKLNIHEIIFKKGP